MIGHHYVSPDSDVLLIVSSQSEGTECLMDLGSRKHRQPAGSVERHKVERAMGSEQPIKTSRPAKMRIFLGIFNRHLGRPNALGFVQRVSRRQSAVATTQCAKLEVQSSHFEHNLTRALILHRVAHGFGRFA